VRSGRSPRIAVYLCEDGIVLKFFRLLVAYYIVPHFLAVKFHRVDGAPRDFSGWQWEFPQWQDQNSSL
jgi:hypothetical protein